MLRLKPFRLLAACESRECVLLPVTLAVPFDRRAIPSPRNENREKRTMVRANAGLRKK